jgi:hypothetical protein
MSFDENPVSQHDPKEDSLEFNPTIISYNAEKTYNSTCSLVVFKNKNIFFYFVKRSIPPQRWRCI